MVTPNGLSKTELRFSGADYRYNSIDEVRGAVMVLMALDHVRWFFTNISEHQPETLASATVPLFFARWVTHFCAPAFFLLAGIAIFIYAAKINDRAAINRYLISRGAFLVMLEFTVVGYAWVFSPGYSFGGVIWSLGCSFLLMSVLIRAPVPYLLAGSTLFIAGHNWLSESMSTPLDGWAHFLWVSLYQPGRTIVPLFDYPYFFLFPLLPWLAMMVFGYSLGFLYFRDPVERKKILGAVGSGMILAFLVLRLTGQYGNSDFLWISPTTGGDFQLYEEFGKTFASLLNTEKYPPSLQFTLMTLGPVLLWLAFSSADVAPEDHSRAFRVLILFGRVPLFYYLCHLYLIHVLALIATSVCGQPNEWIQFGADPGSSRPAGYGFGLSVIYFFWLLTITILYFACLWYAKYKREHNYAWLKFM